MKVTQVRKLGWYAVISFFNVDGQEDPSTVVDKSTKLFGEAKAARSLAIKEYENEPSFLGTKIFYSIGELRIRQNEEA